MLKMWNFYIRFKSCIYGSWKTIIYIAMIYFMQIIVSSLLIAMKKPTAEGMDDGKSQNSVGHILCWWLRNVIYIKLVGWLMEWSSYLFCWLKFERRSPINYAGKNEGRRKNFFQEFLVSLGERISILNDVGITN